MPPLEARGMEDEATATRTVKGMAHRHVAVIPWSRTADLVNGEFGEPVVLFQNGDVPEMES